MRAAFTIPPVQNNFSQLHLLVEAGAENISFVFFTKNPLQIAGLMIFNMDKNLAPMQIAAEVDSEISNQPILMEEFASCTIVSNFKESLLVPAKYFDENISGDMLHLMYGESTATLFKDSINQGSIFNIYRIEDIIKDVLKEYYSGSAVFHSTSLQLQKPVTQLPTLTCMVYHNAVKVILYHNEKIQVVKYFTYNIALDVAYHLLNICKQHHVSNEEVSLSLCGMIDEGSNLYTELYKYFLHISFDNMPVEIIGNEQLLQYPLHFFSHLTYMASCVS